MIKEYLTRNWLLKLLALFLALVLWVILIPEEKTFAEKNLTLEVELVNIPPDIEVVDKADTTINLKVRARKRLLNNLTAEQFSAQLDMSKATVYQQEYPLDASIFKLPPEVELVSFSPAYIHVKLEKTKKVEMEVVPTIIGRPPEGYRIIKLEVNPSKVMVAGPESKIKPRDKVITSPIDASFLTDNVSLEVDLILPRAGLKLLALYPKARVNIQIEKRENNGSTAEINKNKKKNSDYDYWSF
ncbi:MAG: CdaR family protein [Candidatus Saccharicenans sp.]|nr:MAG: hypothetical protein C0168_08695 [Candidatus Aminicenantes bacterium]HEK85740.1 YbbR-like domain-containing protein [Candidatus Aminicenantes bacterium]